MDRSPLKPGLTSPSSSQQQQHDKAIIHSSEKGIMSESSSSSTSAAAYEALFDSGYSTGLLSAHSSGKNIQQESEAGKQQHANIEEVVVPTSDSGLCLDSRTDDITDPHISSLHVKEVVGSKERDEETLFPASPASLLLPSSSSSLTRRVDLSKIGPESLVPNPSEGQSLLHLSIVRGWGDLALALIQKSPHPDLLDVRNWEGKSAMHLAAATGQAILVRRLLVSGATVDLRDWEGDTALHMACGRGDVESVKAILKPISPSEVLEVSLDYYLPQIQGCDMISLMHEMNYSGQTCLHMAARTGNRRLVEYLKSLGGNFNIREGKCGWTCLHSAVHSQRMDLVQLLTSVCRVDVNVTCYSGKTPVEAALSLSKSRSSSPQVIRSIILLLMESGANRHEYISDSDSEEDSDDTQDEGDDEEREDEGEEPEDKHIGSSSSSRISQNCSSSSPSSDHQVGRNNV